MTRVLLIGYAPDAVDYSDPTLPTGLNPEKIRHGIEVALEQMRTRGWEVGSCMLRPDDSAGPVVERELSSGIWDCVVIGAGVRLPPPSLMIFEMIINAVRKHAPSAAIAFNTHPEVSADAAGRWVR